MFKWEHVLIVTFQSIDEDIQILDFIRETNSIDWGNTLAQLLAVFWISPCKVITVIKGMLTGHS